MEDQNQNSPKKRQTIKRNSIRYVPEPNTVAWVDLDCETPEFKPMACALVFSESFRGCGLVMLDTKHVQLEVGDSVRVKVGELDPIEAEVRWREQLHPDVVKIGLMYKDL